MVYIAGGNGGNSAVHAINNELEKRGVLCSVAGLPKSIDNDILLIDKCFGFDTAVAEAERAIQSAVVEARSQLHGVGVVKLMGRSAGFIAAQASIASGEVDVCLIPELPFNVEKARVAAMTSLRVHPPSPIEPLAGMCVRPQPTPRPRPRHRRHQRRSGPGAYASRGQRDSG